MQLHHCRRKSHKPALPRREEKFVNKPGTAGVIATRRDRANVNRRSQRISSLPPAVLSPRRHNQHGIVSRCSTGATVAPSARSARNRWPCVPTTSSRAASPSPAAPVPPPACRTRGRPAARNPWRRRCSTISAISLAVGLALLPGRLGAVELGADPFDDVQHDQLGVALEPSHRRRPRQHRRSCSLNSTAAPIRRYATAGNSGASAVSARLGPAQRVDRHPHQEAAQRQRQGPDAGVDPPTAPAVPLHRLGPLVRLQADHRGVQPDHHDGARPRQRFQPRPVGERAHPAAVAGQLHQRNDGERQLKAQDRLAQDQQLEQPAVGRRHVPDAVTGRTRGGDLQGVRAGQRRHRCRNRLLAVLFGNVAGSDSTSSAGTMAARRVTSRRTHGRTRSWTKPSITTCPASVPVSVELWPDASSATREQHARGQPCPSRRRRAAVWASCSVSTSLAGKRRRGQDQDGRVDEERPVQRQQRVEEVVLARQPLAGASVGGKARVCTSAECR